MVHAFKSISRDESVVGKCILAVYLYLDDVYIMHVEW